MHIAARVGIPASEQAGVLLGRAGWLDPAGKKRQIGTYGGHGRARVGRGEVPTPREWLVGRFLQAIPAPARREWRALSRGEEERRLARCVG